MPINPLKEFFKRRKADVKFGRAGPGQTLSSGTSEPSSSGNHSSAREAAAEAAMKRFNKDNTKPAQRPRITPPSQETKPPPTQQATHQVGMPNPVNDTASKTTHVAQLETQVIEGSDQRNVQLYSTEELSQRIKQPEIDDDFFRLTVEDAKLFKQRYNEEKERNEILRTSEMRRREAEAKKPTTNFARLRFRLPNNLVLEASFSGNESLSTVRDWLIAACIEKAGLELKNFDILFGLRPFKEVDYEKSVKQLGLIPATTLTIVSKNL